ncbi:FGGY-family carbohydrate kinase [Agromyces mangrovi Wang et al. 2018]|uniref:FGGY-family carbohydrate kinase n=1 Tax=Agromyces mangrovi TaxID=1858653 RepID=UPI0025736760|nr:FGGY family carbohydrate kinase [Agromyces mangrovi]BDZ64763.1 carbohydrate kinase [Agromyces mangrovi]
MRTTITVDVGTTSIKLSVFDADADLVASHRISTPTMRDAAGEIYDARALRAAVVEFVARLAPAQRQGVERVAITGVGESGGLVRADLSLASPLILWHDQRGAPLLSGLGRRERTRIYEVTGLPVSGNYGLSKAAWAAREAGPEASDAQWLNVAEYLAAVMTGERWSEPSLASRTMALDLTSGTWSDEVCDLFGLRADVFPRLRAAADGVRISQEFASSVGLSSDVVVHVAGHDHMVGGVGAELQPGELLNSTGTTEGLLFLRDAPTLDEHAERAKLANGLSCAGDGYTLFASIPTGGSAFATLQHLTGLDASELGARTDRLHERYLDGALDPMDAPIVLPRFRGSPPPTKDASARGIVAGLRADTGVDDLVFGCFLGMALQFRDVLDLFPLHADRIKVIGPASGNLLWQQLKADLLGVALTSSRDPQVVSQGAQALASDHLPAWASTDPYDTPADADRHARLTGWADAIASRWEYLKGMPS